MGTTFIAAFKVSSHYEKTEGVIIVGEAGGRAEEDAADWIKEYRQCTANPKPFIVDARAINI